ncbi:MAG: adenylosuccinate synthetase [Bdellovibrionales bacterium]|nr:adenylosuccinate synthetase [Bdellovibrionales bacterium]
MANASIWIVCGLGFGDEGKGTISEFLASYSGAEGVVRYNGGPQAAHHVVREDGTVHCFSQFGSGSFLKRVRSHLAHTVLVKPTNLLVERDALIEKGVDDLGKRFSLDPNANVVTPWHAMLGRMEEVSRGADAHGSVGMGVGKAAKERSVLGEKALSISDLTSPSSLRDKLVAHWDRTISEAELLLSRSPSHSELNSLFHSYGERASLETMYEEYQKLGEILSPHFSSDTSFGELISSKHLILEGAQGVLLDYVFGFFPHVTKTDTTFASAEPFIRASGLKDAQIARVGVLRAYATRHGAGPFVSEERSLESVFHEPHNGAHRWQGRFRVGHFDLVASRYAVAASGKPDILAFTHLDTVGRQPSLKVVETYSYKGKAPPDELECYFEMKSNRELSSIRLREDSDQKHQSRLTELLRECVPGRVKNFEGWGAFHPTQAVELPLALSRFLEFLESENGLGLPVSVLSFGPTSQDKMVRSSLLPA